MSVKLQLGLRIKELRKKAELTQAKLAEIVSIDAKHQSCIENGKNFPSADLIEKYAKTFKIEPDELLLLSHSISRKELIKKLDTLMESASDKELGVIYRIAISVIK